MVKRAERKPTKVILDVARIHRVKGHEILLKAFGKLAPTHRNWKVRIVGQIEDKRYHRELLSLTKELEHLKAGKISWDGGGETAHEGI